jgi:hypothetical protein
MKQRICSNCAYGVYEPTICIQMFARGWPALLVCANSAEAPGRIRPVLPKSTCRNFVARHDPSYRLPAPEPQTGDIRFIPLTQGKFAIVDAADYEWLSKYHWLSATTDKTTYAYRIENGKRIKMHREIMKPRKGQVVDHINHNGADNRRSNTRNCSSRQNSCNARPRRGTSQYRGVCRSGDRWLAYVGYLWRAVNLGAFDSEIEAARAHDRKAIELHGEYAYLNLPEEWPPEKREALYNSPEAVQARAEAKRRSRKLLRARRMASGAEGRKVKRKVRP